MLLRILDPCMTTCSQFHSSELRKASAPSSDGNHVADLDVGPQLLQFVQPDHLLMGKAITGAFDFHQLEEQFQVLTSYGNGTAIPIS